MSEVYRREVKYVVSLDEFFGLRTLLQQLIQPDEHSGETGYMVRSLYFDSSYDKDLLDVLDGVEEKSKIRLRVYSTDDVNAAVKLEHKFKLGLDSRKSTLHISRAEAMRIAAGDYALLLGKKDPLALKLYARLKTGGYLPKIIVQYRRLAYSYLPNNARITFDIDVSASSVVSAFLEPTAAFRPIAPPGIGVLEIKYNGFLFGHLQKAIEAIDASPSANSKYAIGRLASIY